MSVITTFELDDLVPPGNSTGETNRAHCRFRSGTDHAQLFDGRHELADLRREPGFDDRRGAEAQAPFRGLLDGIDNLRVGVAEDHRSPRSDIVDQLPAVLRAKPCAPGTFYEQWLAADAGEISIFGVDARADPLAAKQLVAWLPDEPMLYDKLTAWEYLEFIAGLWRVETSAAEHRAEELLRLLGLWDNRNDRCETFSRGMKQKAVLAGALIHDPKLLMLDEPLTGLDAAASRQVKDMLRQKVADGASVILTTHILEVAERMSDRIGIIKGGTILVEGALGELQTRAGAEGQSLEDVFLSLTAGEGVALTSSEAAAQT